MLSGTLSRPPVWCQTCAVEHDHGMRARRDMEADLVEVQAHRFGIDAPRHKASTDPTCCADRAE